MADSLAQVLLAIQKYLQPRPPEQDIAPIGTPLSLADDDMSGILIRTNGVETPTAVSQMMSKPMHYAGFDASKEVHEVMVTDDYESFEIVVTLHEQVVSVLISQMYRTDTGKGRSVKAVLDLATSILQDLHNSYPDRLAVLQLQDQAKVPDALNLHWSTLSLIAFNEPYYTYLHGQLNADKVLTKWAPVASFRNMYYAAWWKEHCYAAGLDPGDFRTDVERLWHALRGRTAADGVLEKIQNVLIACEAHYMTDFYRAGTAYNTLVASPDDVHRDWALALQGLQSDDATSEFTETTSFIVQRRHERDQIPRAPGEYLCMQGRPYEVWLAVQHAKLLF